jgi:hypothetical protein
MSRQRGGVGWGATPSSTAVGPFHNAPTEAPLQNPRSKPLRSHTRRARPTFAAPPCGERRTQKRPRKTRFPRSERFCLGLLGGAGGTRTHGRRIMSPLGILAALVDRCWSMTFLQLRAGELCRHPLALVGLFLSLRPEHVPNAPRMDGLSRRGACCASSWEALVIPRSGFPFQRAEAPPLYLGWSLCSHFCRPDVMSSAYRLPP